MVWRNVLQYTRYIWMVIHEQKFVILNEFFFRFFLLCVCLFFLALVETVVESC